jgi:hypothetical protein
MTLLRNFCPGGGLRFEGYPLPSSLTKLLMLYADYDHHLQSASNVSHDVHSQLRSKLDPADFLLYSLCPNQV